MAYQIPPLTDKRRKGGIFRAVRFSKPVASPIYYEDEYGVENDEDAVVREGGSDVCESESDSEVNLSSSERTKTRGFGRGNPKPTVSEDNGTTKENVPFLEISDDSDSSSDDMTLPRSLKIQNVQSRNKGATFRIAPNINPKRSLLLSNKQFGMFGGGEAQCKNGNQTKIAQRKLCTELSPDSKDGAALQNNFEPKQTKASARLTLKTAKTSIGRDTKRNVPGLRHPTHRELLKQQLANRSKETKIKMAATRAMGKAEKDAKKTSQKGEMRTAQVQADNSDIDLSEYEKYD